MTTRAGEESLVAAIDDPAATRALAAERALVRALEADCHTPVGAHAEVLGSDALRLRAFVGPPTAAPGCATSSTARTPSAWAPRSPSGC